MKHCYEYFIVGTTIKKRNDKGQIAIETNDLYGMIFPDDATEALDKILEKFDTDASIMTWKLENTFRTDRNFPWAIVFYKEEFRLAGHVVSTRKDRNDVLFTCYTMPNNHSVQEHGVPSVSILLIYSKSSLKGLANDSELFSKAWEQLSECDEDRHWICVAETPTKEWIEKTSKDDDQLFLGKLGIATN